MANMILLDELSNLLIVDDVLDLNVKFSIKLPLSYSEEGLEEGIGVIGHAI